MENRVSVIFKLHGEVVIVENRDLFLNEIDVTSEGMVFWTALNHVPIKGVYCILEEGSDEHLDAINNGTIGDYLNFFI